ncbi:hypothetical protein CYK37_29025 [Mesorhizobium loti]|nr:hypothetical protein CYK37_29025 [Mesorhizobium loti]
MFRQFLRCRNHRQHDLQSAVKAVSDFVQGFGQNRQLAETKQLVVARLPGGGEITADPSKLKKFSCAGMDFSIALGPNLLLALKG